MKRVIIAVIALFVFAATANAQNKKKQFLWNKKYMAEIGLSADQQTKIEAIKTSSGDEVKAVKADATLSEDAKKTKLQDLQKKRMTAIEAVLTDDQKKKVEEIKMRLKKEN